MAGDDYERARDEYRQAMDAYGEAVAQRAPDVIEVFQRATNAWRRLRAEAPPAAVEGQVSEGMHVVVGFSHAVGAGHVAEAERLYNAMSAEDRDDTDRADASAPGAFKIWLRSP